MGEPAEHYQPREVPPDDPSVMGRVTLADDDDAYDQRNILGVALRRMVMAVPVKSEEFHIGFDALSQVFPGDALGEKGLYDCPTGDGRDVMGEKMEAGE